jgi:lincosamide nucleotidyltransferase A/C/D/E
VTGRLAPWRARGDAALYRVIRVVYRVLARSPVHRLLSVSAVERLHRRVTAPRVTYADVVEILRALSAEGIRAWLIGGWGCDALLGEQTRNHSDLDLVIPESEEQQATHTLEGLGFGAYGRFSSRLLSEAVELIDRPRRRKVALHLVDIDSRKADCWKASLMAGMQEIGLDASELFATGYLNGDELPCLSAPVQLLLHIGYEPGEADRRDVSLLCSRFSLPLPPGYGPAAGRPGQ